MTYEDLLERYAPLIARLHQEKRTGAVTLHLSQGIPVQAEFPNKPEIVRLTVDKGAKKTDTTQ